MRRSAPLAHDGSAPPPPLALRAPDAARALGLSPRSLWTLTNQGLIPHVRIGRTLIYPVAKLQEWLTARAEGGQQP